MVMLAGEAPGRNPLVELKREAAYLGREDRPAGARPENCWEQA